MAKRKRKNTLSLRSYVTLFLSILGLGTAVFWVYQWLSGSSAIPVIEPSFVPRRTEGKGPKPSSLPTAILYQKISGLESKKQERLLPPSEEEPIDVSTSIDHIMKKEGPSYHVGPVHPSLEAAKTYWKKIRHLFSGSLEARAQQIPGGKKTYRIVVTGDAEMLEKILQKKKIPYKSL